MEHLEVGDYVIWQKGMTHYGKPGKWRERYDEGPFVVTKIVNRPTDRDGYSIRVRHANGKRMMGPFWEGWFQKSTFLGMAAKAIQDATHTQPKTQGR